MSDLILVERDDGIATVVFNRPKMRNAISLAMWAEIARVTEELAKDDSVRAIVYRGAGTRGLRLRRRHLGVPGEPQGHRDARSRYNKHDRGRLQRHPRVPQADGGHDLRLLHGRRDGAWPWRCDFRFAAEGSKFGIPAARLSIIYGLDPVHQLVDLVGPAYAKDILYSARTVDDQEALRIGFIQRLVPADDLEKHTYDYLRGVAANAPLSVRGTKAQVQAIFDGITDAHREKLRVLGIETFDSAGLQGRHARIPREAAAPVPGPLAGPAADAPAHRGPLLHAAQPARGQRHVRRDRGAEPRPRRPSATRSTVRPLGRRTGFHTLDRWLYNARRRAGAARATSTSWSGWISTAFSGRGAGAVPFVASLKGIIADELRNERGWVRALLTRAGALGAPQHRARRPRHGAEPLLAPRWPRRRVRRARRSPRRGARADRPRGLGRRVRRAPRRPRTGVPSCSPSRACTRASASQDLLHAAADAPHANPRRAGPHRRTGAGVSARCVALHASWASARR